MNNLKELQEDFNKEVSKTEFDFITLYHCLVDVNVDYFDCEYYDSEYEDKVMDMINFRKDIFKKYNIKKVKEYNTGDYGDPYYTVNLVFSVNDTFHVAVSYYYDSYESNEYNGKIKEVTPIQEVKVRFR
jgi:hypothetical protein